MSAQASHEESGKSLWLLEEKSSESRPLTPPCRKILGKQPTVVSHNFFSGNPDEIPRQNPPASEGLVVLPPDTSSVCFNSTAKTMSQTSARGRSADRIERKLHSVKSIERSDSAGARLIEEKCCGFSTACNKSNKENLNGPVQYSSNTNQPIEKKPHNVPESFNMKDTSNGGLHAVNGENSCLDNAMNELPIELTAEFLSCVMKEDYESALSLCNKILSIDPQNKTCLEFQDVIKEKLQQDAQSEEDEDDDDDEESSDESSGETDDDDEEDDDDDEEDDDDDDDDDEDDSDDDDESSDNSSESDIELPVGPINLLMGGLPLRTASRSSQPDNS